MEQLIESIEIARITRSQPSKYQRLVEIGHRAKLTLCAQGVPARP
jgi:hypothetical protein